MCARSIERTPPVPAEAEGRRETELLRQGLDRSSPVPLYHQLVRALQKVIEDGVLFPGAQLNNEIALARDLGLSRPTVRRALGFLVERGLLIRKRGIGTVVVATNIRRPIRLTSLYDDLTESGRRPATRVLGLRTVHCPLEVATGLHLPATSEVLHIRRLRLVDGEPLAIMENYLPEGLAALCRADLEEAGLYRLLRGAGVSLRIASQRIGARRATPREAELLQMENGDPILSLLRISYDDTGRAVEYASHAYAAERYAFEMNLVRDSL
ncbi:MAG TPA: GntR family transcriptional regulator [Candidatus Dormibacteraeota bacterium]|jgi:DNA-binding GntR family transcriptional regulator|nr:GntR family transcriptional regulator [Candidatus Dormibacteraeota bacterium]